MILSLFQAIFESLLPISLDSMLHTKMKTVSNQPMRFGITRYVMNTIDWKTGHSGDFHSLETEIGYKPGKIIVQRHHASHKHFDVSIISGDKELFRGAVSKKELENLFPKGSKKTSLVQQPVHDVEYVTNFGKDGWEKIESGYGAGEVKQELCEDIALSHIEPGHISFALLGSKFAGNYTLHRIVDEQIPLRWRAINAIEGNNIPMKGSWIFLERKYDGILDERHRYKNFDLDIVEKMDDAVIESKVDGNNERIIFKDGKIRIWGSRPNKDGKVIEHTYHVPHLLNVDEKTRKELDGTILHGELFHQKGVSFTAGLLNSLAPKAVATQSDAGGLQVAVFDVVRYKGQDTKDMTYNERRALYEDICSRIKSPDIFPVHQYTSVDPKIAFDSEQEGLVIKHGNDKFDETVWKKVKHSNTYDCEIVDVFDSSDGSKYDGKAIGGFIVRNGESFVRVGSGLSDELREAAFANPDKYIGQVAVVQAMEETSAGSLRAPRFEGFHPEKASEMCELPNR